MAAVPTHVARVAFLAISKKTGLPVNKDDPNTTISDTLQTEHKHVVLPDSNLPSSINPSKYPTVEDYIVREGQAGFKVQFMSQTMIISYG